MDGYQIWIGEHKNCVITNFTAVSVTLAILVAMTVEIVGGTPQLDLPMYVFDSDDYTSYHGMQEINGEVGFALLGNPDFATCKP